MIEAHLMGLSLTSPDVRKLADFYADALCYDGRWNGTSWIGTLSDRQIEISDGPGNALRHATFAVSDEAQLAGLRARLTAASIAFEETEATGIAGMGLRFADPDGNILIFGLQAETGRSTKSAMSARLQHVVYASDQVFRSLHFYCEILGFSASDYVRDETGDLTSVFLRCSEEHHSVAVFRAPKSRLDHFCYDVDDWSQIRDWADWFADRHITLRWGPGRHGPGNNLFLFVNDPDNNWLEFSAELERVVGGRPIKEWRHEERTLNSWGKAYLRS